MMPRSILCLLATFQNRTRRDCEGNRLRDIAGSRDADLEVAGSEIGDAKLTLSVGGYGFSLAAAHDIDGGPGDRRPRLIGDGSRQASDCGSHVDTDSRRTGGWN